MRTILLLILAAAGINLKAQSPVYEKNFGIITEGISDTITYELYNNDTSVLELGKWRGGCACVRLEFDTKPVKANSFYMVKFIYNSSGNTGNITRYAKIAVLKGGKPADSITLILKGYVLPAYSAEIIPDSATATAVHFYETEYYFGFIPQGINASGSFKFINTSQKPVAISNCQSSCGCMVPYWKQDPVMPGETGTIGITFNAASGPGPFHKTLSVYFTNGQSFYLAVKGEIIPK